MARSSLLTHRSLGRIIAVYLLTALMGFILTAVLQSPAYIFGGNIFSMKAGAHISTSFLFWSYFGGFLGKAMAGPIATIAIALIYYDERVRKEAFDLQLMMDSLGQTSPAQASASTSSA